MATSGGGTGQKSKGDGDIGQNNHLVNHDHQLVGAEEVPLKASYASKVTGNKKPGREKLNVLDVFFERKNDAISYSLSKEELAKLIFKKMCIDPKSILKIDTSGYGKINIELDKSVDLEPMINMPVFEIREGLRTKFYRPHHRKDSLVTISWLDIETPDSLVSHVMSHFGNLKSNIQWVKFKKEEDESELASMLNNILSGERQVWMEIDKPIPSYGIIDGRKVKIYHPGQRRTCARCQKTADQCLGNSNAKLCDERGGNKVAVENVWKDILKNVGYSEWNDKKETSQEVEENTEVQKSEIIDTNFSNDYPNCDGLVFSNLPEDISNDELEKVMEKCVVNCSDQVSILPGESLRSRFIKINNINLISEFVRKMDNKSYQGRLLHCRPHVPVTPPKLQQVENESQEDNPTVASASITVTEPTLKELSEIPGLTEAERLKAKKTAEKKKKNAEAKERRRKRKEEQEKEDNNKKLSRGDFLEAVDGNELSVAQIVEKFDFTDYSSDESDLFEDSKENVSGDEIRTPLLKGKQQVISKSTSNSKGSKRSITSPCQGAILKKQK